MTINRHDKFAFTPKRCGKCNRLFIFEGYDICYRDISPKVDSEYIKCKYCHDFFRIPIAKMPLVKPPKGE